MMPEPSTAPQPEGWDPEEEDHSPCPQDHGDEDISAGPGAASMEGAISKFMEGLEGQERSGFPQIHRLLSLLPVPVQKKSRSHGLTSYILLPRRPSKAAASAQPNGKPASCT